MKRFLIAVAFLLPVFGVTAQNRETPSEPKLNLSLQDRYTIKEIVKDLHVAPAPSNQDISVGAEVPNSVKLEPMPAQISAKVPRVKSHLFFIEDNKVVLVEAKDRKIVEVIE